MNSQRRVRDKRYRDEGIFDPAGKPNGMLPELEAFAENDEIKHRFRDTGIRVEVDGDEFIVDHFDEDDGCLVLRQKGKRDGMIRANDGREARLYADMSSNIVATGGTESSKERENE